MSILRITVWRGTRRKLLSGLAACSVTASAGCNAFESSHGDSASQQENKSDDRQTRQQFAHPFINASEATVIFPPGEIVVSSLSADFVMLQNSATRRTVVTIPSSSTAVEISAGVYDVFTLTNAGSIPNSRHIGKVQIGTAAYTLSNWNTVQFTTRRNVVVTSELLRQDETGRPMDASFRHTTPSDGLKAVRVVIPQQLNGNILLSVMQEQTNVKQQLSTAVTHQNVNKQVDLIVPISNSVSVSTPLSFTIAGNDELRSGIARLEFLSGGAATVLLTAPS